VIGIPQFYYNNNGEYRVIFKETGTNCRDTAYSSFYALKAPKLTVNFTYTCFGGYFKVGDARNTSGAGSTYQWDDGNGGPILSNVATYNKYCPCGWVIVQGGSPSVSVTNSNGCTATSYYLGTISNVFPAAYSISVSQNPIGPGQFSLLIANSNYPVSSYKWYKTGTSGVLNNSQQIIVNEFMTGQYRVRIKNTDAAGACITNKYVTIQTTPSNRIEDYSDYDAQLSVYPNPASTEITVGGHEGLIEIFDMNGRLLLSKQEQNPISQINIESLSSGIYILKSGEQMMKMVVGH